MSNTADRPAVDAGRLWAGGLATAVVAALVALVGVLVFEAMLDVEMVRLPLIPVGNSFVVRYAVTAAVLALVATALAHLLLVSTPGHGPSSRGSSVSPRWRGSSCHSRSPGRRPAGWPPRASTWSSGWRC
jgi:hypothetical protein